MKPNWPDMHRKRHLQPQAENTGWHTFRRTCALLLASSSADVKVVEEFGRHTKLSTTMNLYFQAHSLDARSAQKNVAQMALDARGHLINA